MFHGIDLVFKLKKGIVRINICVTGSRYGVWVDMIIETCSQQHLVEVAGAFVKPELGFGMDTETFGNFIGAKIHIPGSQFVFASLLGISVY